MRRIKKKQFAAVQSNGDFIRIQARSGALAYTDDQPTTDPFLLNLAGQKVLDLTNPAIAQEWGYVAESGATSTQAIAARAVDDGYTVIKYDSVEVPGTVNYAIFHNFKEILTPRQVISVPWIPASQ